MILINHMEHQNNDVYKFPMIYKILSNVINNTNYQLSDDSEALNDTQTNKNIISETLYVRKIDFNIHFILYLRYFRLT